MSPDARSRSPGESLSLCILLLFGGSVLVLTPAARADGNVSAFVDASGNLWVVGDGADNSLRISDDTGVADEFELEDGWGGTTTVNGQERAYLVAPGPHIFLSMRGGNDRVTFGTVEESACCGRSVMLRCDEGDDFVTLNEYSAMGPLTVDLGSGDDLFVAGEDSGMQELSLAAGEGADRVLVHSYSGVHGDATIDLGPGVDEFSWGDASVHSLSVDGAADSDRIFIGELSLAGHAVLTGGPGDDLVEVDTAREFTAAGTERGPLAIDAGEGADRVLLRGPLDLEEGVVVQAGNGADVVRLDGVELHGDLAVSLGAEDDRLAVHASVFGLGPAVHSVVFDGGTGTDQLLESGNDYLSDPPERTGFEAPRPRENEPPIAITTTIVGRVVLAGGEGVPAASVAIPELGLVTVADDEGRFRFDSVSTRLTTLEIAAGATVHGVRRCGVVTAWPVPFATTSPEEIVLARRASTVCLFGDEQRDARALEQILVELGRGPEALFRRRFLPEDLTPFQVVWHVGRNAPLSQEDRERLAAFVRSGGGLDLAGDGAALHDSHREMVNALLATGEIDIVSPGNEEWFPIAYNPDAVGGAGFSPNLLGGVSRFYGPRILTGVAHRNAFIEGVSGQVFAGLWGEAELAGGRGRLSLGLISLWLAASENAPGIENLQAFLQGAGEPPLIR